MKCPKFNCLIIAVLMMVGILMIPTSGHSVENEIKKDIPVPEMVALPGGSYKMGCVSGKNCRSDEKPVHRVKISAFEMGSTEVTFEQWDACVADGGCKTIPDDAGWGRGCRPVINVTWEDAQHYIDWLKKKTRENYRLPTEAEWEYAARAGSSTKYSWGNDKGDRKANCNECSQLDNKQTILIKKQPCFDVYGRCGSQWDNKKTAPVKSFEANAFGLYDMHGNVWEWVQDWYEAKYYKNSSSSDPAGPVSGRYRVTRGGSWDYDARSMRSANRYYDGSGRRRLNVGFRLVRIP